MPYIYICVCVCVCARTLKCYETGEAETLSQVFSFTVVLSFFSVFYFVYFGPVIPKNPLTFVAIS